MSENLDFWQVEVDIDAFFDPKASQQATGGAGADASDQPAHHGIWEEQDHAPFKGAAAAPAPASVPAHVSVAPSTLSYGDAPSRGGGKGRLFSVASVIVLLALIGWYVLPSFGVRLGADDTDTAGPVSDPMAFMALSPADLAPPPQHEARVYIDTQNKIFLQGVLPVYLHLSTAPDEAAPKFILHKNGIPDRVSPLVLGGEGEQILSYGGDEYYLYADRTPPVTEAQMLGTRSAVRDDMTYYGPGLVSALVSQDETAGVEASFFSIDGAPFRAYQDSLYFGKQKRYNLRYYAVDWVGNAATPETHAFIVDLTPPRTLLAFEKPFEQSTVSPRTRVQLSTTDALSGEGPIFYKFDQSAAFQVYTEPFSLDLNEGEHVLYYYAEDAVGNAAAVQTHAFYLDRTPPVVEYRLSGDQFTAPDGTVFLSPRTSVQLQASDNKVGVAQIEYALNNQPPEVYQDSLQVPAAAGAHLILYRATDRVLNVQVQDSLVVEMDPHVPASRYVLEGPTFHLRDTLYITESTVISFEASDAESGVAAIHYSLDDAPEQPYTTPISIREPGPHLLSFFATDQVNNQELPNRVSFIVDKTPPEVFFHFSRAPYAQRREGGETLGVYAKNTLLYLGATDNVSGTRQIYYSINDAPEQVHQGTVSNLTTAGLYTIQIRVEDNVRNTSLQTIRFFIGDD